MKNHSRRARLLSLLIAFGLACAAGSARADTIIFDNLNNSNNGFRGVTDTNWDAQRFNSDSTNLFLTSVTLNLFSSGGSGNFFLDLYSDNANQPGISLANLYTGPTLGTGDILFSNLNLPLSPNTNYWLVLGDTTGSTLSLSWGVTTTLTGTGSGFQTTAALTTDSGMNWFVFNNAPYRTQITASTVPEPTTMLLGALGGFGLLAASRRRLSR